MARSPPLLMLGALLLVLAASAPMHDTALPTVVLGVTLMGCFSHVIAASTPPPAGVPSAPEQRQDGPSL